MCCVGGRLFFLGREPSPRVPSAGRCVYLALSLFQARQHAHRVTSATRIPLRHALTPKGVVLIEHPLCIEINEWVHLLNTGVRSELHVEPVCDHVNHRHHVARPAPTSAMLVVGAGCVSTRRNTALRSGNVVYRVPRPDVRRLYMLQRRQRVLLHLRKMPRRRAMWAMTSLNGCVHAQQAQEQHAFDHDEPRRKENRCPVHFLRQ